MTHGRRGAPGSAADGPTLLGGIQVLLLVLGGRREVFPWLLGAGRHPERENENGPSELPGPGRVGQVVTFFPCVPSRPHAVTHPALGLGERTLASVALEHRKGPGQGAGGSPPAGLQHPHLEVG